MKLKQNKNLVLKQGKGQKKMTKKELEFKKLVKAKLSKKQEKAVFNVFSKTEWDSNSINNAMLMLQIQADFEHEQADKIIKLFIKN